MQAVDHLVVRRRRDCFVITLWLCRAEEIVFCIPCNKRLYAIIRTFIQCATFTYFFGEIFVENLCQKASCIVLLGILCS
jgi:hypothetical protein